MFSWSCRVYCQLKLLSMEMAIHVCTKAKMLSCGYQLVLVNQYTTRCCKCCASLQTKNKATRVQGGIAKVLNEEVISVCYQLELRK